MNLKIFILILSFSGFYSSSSVNKHLDSNGYVTKYDKVSYDILIKPEDVHRRISKRDITATNEDKNIQLTFFSYGRFFNLSLYPTDKNLFNNQYIELNNETNRVPLKKFLSLYRGYLADEPNSSYASGAIIDGLFYGTFWSSKLGKYHIEPAKRYNKSDESHSIIYHESDVDMSKFYKRYNSSTNSYYSNSSNSHDGLFEGQETGCGFSYKDIISKMNEDYLKYDDIMKKRSADSFYSTNSEYRKKIHEYEKYYKESNQNRFKRSSSDPIRLEFPDERSVCNLFLKVDPFLYKEIFVNEGNHNEQMTITYLLFFLNKQVEYINNLFGEMKFFNSAQDKYYSGLQFMVQRVKIITSDECFLDGSNIRPEDLKLCEANLDVFSFLNQATFDNFDDYCLGFVFSARDFNDGTLGLAWLAKPSIGLGGACEKQYFRQGSKRSYNTGVVTVINYKAHVPEAVTHLTFAHELGHSFGAEHDPDNNNECSPGNDKQGNFIMYRRANTGRKKNNKQFSPCSLGLMGKVMHSIVDDPKRFCFKKFNGPLCGNGIIEDGEECDCGFKEDCKEDCCFSGSEEDHEKRCKLKPFAKCSPSQGLCCDINCEYKLTTTICRRHDDCLFDVHCTGNQSYCPTNSSEYFKPNFSICNYGTQICMNGKCSNSICEKFNMTQCSLDNEVDYKYLDKSKLCHLACIGDKTDNKCVESSNITEMVENSKGLSFILKPGTPCLKGFGYCDTLSKCRSVDAEGPLSNLFLKKSKVKIIIYWITNYKWLMIALLLMAIIFFGVGISFFKPIRKRSLVIN